MMMVAKLSDLPPELLDRVCYFVDAKKALVHLSRCSRQLCAAATPHLYRHIDLLSTPAADVDRHLDTLVSLFLSHTEVASHVRYLAIRMPDCRAPREESTVRAPEIQEFIRRLDDIFPSSETKPRPGLEAQTAETTPAVYEESEEEDEIDEDGYGDDDNGSIWTSNEDMSGKLSQKATEVQRWVILVILLTRLQKLETLDLEFSQPAYCGEIFDMILRFNERAISARLPNIDKICFGYSSVPARGLLCDGTFSFPGLKSVYLHRVTSGASMTFLGEPYTLPVTHLELRDCRLSPPELSNIVKSAKSLKTFVYEVGEPRTTYQRRQNISYQSIRQALESQKDSLESIWVDYPHDYLFDELSGDETRPIGSFRHFTALKRLRMASTYIFGFVWRDNLDVSRLVRALPEQIEVVHLTHSDEDEETMEGVQLVLDAKGEGRLPQLSQLLLEMSHPYFDQHKDELRGLRQQARDADMDIAIFDNYSDDRIVSDQDWVRFSRAGNLGYNREESKWGFDGEVQWPKRVSGCMQRPRCMDARTMAIFPEVSMYLRSELRSLA
ncbi:hypothetical protein PG994_005433 [Apiospora phragmitis]|uniref:F-box domain-containing protein n=1 Tax=Apiospora phragmitis TaxID=2905665 RepID=A0ABR1VC96_9PEZI